MEKTPRQIEAIQLLNSHVYTLLYGGSRSGKTYITIRNIFLRAVKTPSKHLIVRYRYNHARTSLAHETIPNVLKDCFAGLEVEEHRQEGYYTVPTVCGGTSEVWLGGTDDKDRIEKILGNEFSTVFANECSQIPWDAIVLLQTRLAENSGLKLRFYFDANPPNRKHWTYKVFMEGKLPDGSPHNFDTATLQMNPVHNKDNLPEEYFKTLENLPLRARQRFLEGLFLDDIEGALWTREMVVASNQKAHSTIEQVIVAVDPAVTDNPNSDETGIIVCGLDDNKEGVIIEDCSLKASPDKWANTVVDAYHRHNANLIIAETNQGGLLVESIIRNIDPHIKVVSIHASKGKMARAEPVSMLFEQNKVTMLDGMSMLEDELCEWIPGKSGASPNRLDAAVYGLSYLMLRKPAARFHI